MKSLMKILAASAVFVLGVAGANAGPSTGSADLKLKLRIVGGCTVSLEGGQTEFDLGSYSNLQNEISRDGNLEVRCSGIGTDGLPVSVALDNGISGDRSLLADAKGNSTRIKYEVYKFNNNTRGGVWGSTGESLQQATIKPADGSPDGFVLVPFQVVVNPVTGGVAVGTYTDTVKATITYEM